MTSLPLIAQSTADTSSAAAVIFGVLALVGIISILGITSQGRRRLLPLIAVLLGALIAVTAASDAVSNSFSVLTFLSLFIALILISGGIGALREGTVLPDVTRPDDSPDHEEI